MSNDPKITNTPILGQNADSRYRRVLNYSELVYLGLSLTIGSGIFVLIDNVAKYGGTLAWFSMLIAGIISLLTAFSYGELASMFHNNLAEYGYIATVTNQSLAKIVGLIILISDVFILSTIALGLGNYLSVIIPLSPVVLAIIMVILLNYLNYCGISTSTQVNHFSLIIKLGALGFIFIVSLFRKSCQDQLTETKNVSGHGLMNGAVIGLFAYLGFNSLVNFSEESIDPHQSMSHAIITTVILVTIIYVLLTISFQCVLGSKATSQTNTPIATLSQKLFGNGGQWLFILLAIVSLTDTLLVTSVSESRYIHAYTANINQTWGQIDMHPINQTPYLSVIGLTIITALMIYGLQQIEITSIYSDLIMLIVFTVINLIVIILRYTMPKHPRPFQIPLNIGRFPLIPAFGFLIGLYIIYNYWGS